MRRALSAAALVAAVASSDRPAGAWEVGFERCPELWNCAYDYEHRAIARAALQAVGADAFADDDSRGADPLCRNCPSPPCTSLQRGNRDVSGSQTCSYDSRITSRTPDGGFCVTDLNSWFIPRDDPFHDRGLPADHLSSPLEERYLPESDHAAEAPDLLYSVYDFIGKASHCVPLPELDRTAPRGATQFSSCHSFVGGWLGMLNSNHFSPQNFYSWQRYHRIARRLAGRAAALREALEGDYSAMPTEPRYRPELRTFVEEAEREALFYEGAAQHFLGDRWSSGHMWERWGFPDSGVRDFGPVAYCPSFVVVDGVPSSPECNFQRRLLNLAAITGLMFHGAQGLAQVPSMQCAPEVEVELPFGRRGTPTLTQLLALYFATTGSIPFLSLPDIALVGPLTARGLRPAQAVLLTDGGSPTPFNMVGDYRYLNLDAGAWNPRNQDPRCLEARFNSVWRVPDGSALPLGTERQRGLLRECTQRSYVEVLRALGPNGSSFGVLPVRADGPTPPRSIDDVNDACWSAWSTNASMRRTFNSIFGEDPETFIDVLGRAVPTLSSGQLDDNFRAALIRLSMVVALEPPDGDNGTSLARGGLGPQLNFPTNRFTPRAPRHFEEEDLDALPAFVDPATFRDFPGRDRRTIFGYFHRAHMDYWCGRADFDDTVATTDFDRPHLNADNSFNLHHLRRPSRLGLDALGRPRVPTTEEREVINDEVHVCEIMASRLFRHVSQVDPTDLEVIENHERPPCETLADPARPFPEARLSPILRRFRAEPLNPRNAPYYIPRQYAPHDVATTPYDDATSPDHVATHFLRTVVNWCERVPFIDVQQRGRGRDAVFFARPGVLGATTPPAAVPGARFLITGRDFGDQGTVELIPTASCMGCAPLPCAVPPRGWEDRRVEFIVNPAAVQGGRYYLKVTNTTDPAHPRSSERYAELEIGGPCSPGDRCGFSLAAGHFVPPRGRMTCATTGPRDLAVGAPGARGQAGLIYLLPADRELDVPAIPIDSSLGVTPNNFGTSLAAGDLDGDGCDDLLVGTPGLPTTSGRAEVLWGGPAFGRTVPTGGARTLLGRGTEPGRGVGEEFGAAVALADVDGDGDKDVLVTAANSPDTRLAPTRRGRVYLFLNNGGRSLGVGGAASSLNVLCPVSDGTLRACPSPSRWGQSLVGARVCSSSTSTTCARHDVLVSSAPFAGAVRWFPRGGPSLQNTFEPGVGALDRAMSAMDEQTGQGLAAGDLDDDGFNDLFVGITRNTAAPAGSVGRLLRMGGQATAAPPTWTPSSPSASPVSFTGDCCQTGVFRWSSCVPASDGGRCPAVMTPWSPGGSFAFEGPSATRPDQGGTRVGVRSSTQFGFSLAVSPFRPDPLDPPGEPATGFLVVGDPLARAPSALLPGAAPGPASGVAWLLHYNRDCNDQGFRHTLLHPLVEPLPPAGARDPRGTDRFGHAVLIANIETDRVPQVIVGAPGYNSFGGAVWVCPNPEHESCTPTECAFLPLASVR
ncbi:MAG: FG-GAP repeat protein [Deltaproteobacteria bacterium]|nr:FG-GAP repeat protein [Deltaproteobacteria bacterium]